MVEAEISFTQSLEDLMRVSHRTGIQCENCFSSCVQSADVWCSKLYPYAFQVMEDMFRSTTEHVLDYCAEDVDLYHKHVAPRHRVIKQIILI